MINLDKLSNHHQREAESNGLAAISAIQVGNVEFATYAARYAAHHAEYYLHVEAQK